MTDYNYDECVQNQPTKEQLLIRMCELFKEHKDMLPYRFAYNFDMNLLMLLHEFKLEGEYYK